MAISESEVKTDVQVESAAQPSVKVRSKKQESILDKGLALLSSVRFGIVMLSLLLICCMIGMLIQQVEVEGFQEYYRRLTPSQQLIYGKLGFFNIYHSWYFSLLLAITGLNIILASIDRFPTAWQYIAKPRLSASPNFIRAQMFSEETRLGILPQKMTEKVRTAWKKHGFKSRVKEEGDRVTIFAQRNVWNRLGAYVVHVALLTIFIGGFLTNRYGIGGMMNVTPGEATNEFARIEDSLEGRRVSTVSVPFDVECVDLQQKLIRAEGGLDAGNTIDWISTIKIKDNGVETPAVVKLNYPFDYRGYRFFQSQFTPIGNAREIKISFVAVDSGDVLEATIQRNDSTEVEGIGRVAYMGFFPDYRLIDSRPQTATGDYNNPVAQLALAPADGEMLSVLAFNRQLAEKSLRDMGEQAGDSDRRNLFEVGGKTYAVILKDFEKVALAHTLAVQYDPGRIPVYIGFTLLFLALCGVFFFSHQRVWAVIEPDGDGAKVYIGGNVNRNRPAFEGRFNLLVQSVLGGGRQNE